ncbi:MAG: SMC-Scp complex subunit ScpB [Firmicutes bacterium]|nr:SMC-Scp complex subunit ScpB [Bacillota bacterium]
MNEVNSTEAAAAIEALLFVTDSPLSTERLKEILQVDDAVLSEAIAALDERCSRPGSGIEIQRVAGGLLLATRPHLSGYVEKLVRTRPTALSQAAFETLAIIAYRQPVTRTEIDAIRGVKSDSAINTLLERNMIKEVGRKQVIGRPMLYGTTREFLKHFGLNSVEELPEVRVDESGD